MIPLSPFGGGPARRIDPCLFRGGFVGLALGIAQVLLWPVPPEHCVAFLAATAIATLASGRAMWWARWKVEQHWESPRLETIRESPALTRQFWMAFDVSRTMSALTAGLALLSLVFRLEQRLIDIHVVLLWMAAGAAGYGALILHKTFRLLKKAID